MTNAPGGVKFNHMVEQRLDSVFHALADGTRRGMLAKLAVEEHSVTALAAPFAMSLAAASKHIKVLEEAGLVSRRVEGRTHVVTLEARRLGEADEWLRRYQHFWTQRLDALERELRKPEPATPRKTKSRRKK